MPTTFGGLKIAYASILVKYEHFRWLLLLCSSVKIQSNFSCLGDACQRVFQIYNYSFHHPFAARQAFTVALSNMRQQYAILS